MPRGRPGQTAETAIAILDIAEHLVQRRGFNGFSYADISAELGMTKASLHYHFASKADLGGRLIERYSERFSDALKEIEDRPDPGAHKLKAYCDIYRSVLADGRMCLCGMLAAEYDTLPDRMREAVVAFFDLNRAWLSNLLEIGKDAGDLEFVGDSDHAARSIVAALEGAMLVSRPYQDTTMIDSVTERVLAEFAADTTGKRRLPRGAPRNAGLQTQRG